MRTLIDDLRNVLNSSCDGNQVSMAKQIIARITDLEKEIARLKWELSKIRGALCNIAACESHAEGDVVDIARKAISGEGK